MRVLEPNNSQYPQTYLAELRHAVLYVFKKYLNKPYSIETDSLDIDYRSNTWSLSIEKNGESVVLPRPNHNILNTLRITSYVPFVVEYFKLYGASKKQFAFIQPEDIKKIQLAMLFNVVGRKNEASWQQSPKLYEKFRKTSGLAFEKYCKKYTLFSAEE